MKVIIIIKYLFLTFTYYLQKIIAELEGDSQCENPRNSLECRRDFIVG